VQVVLSQREPLPCPVEMLLRGGECGAAVARVHGECVLDLTACHIRVFQNPTKQARRRPEPRERRRAAAKRLDESGAQPLRRGANRHVCPIDRPGNIGLPGGETRDPGTTLSVEMPIRRSCYHERGDAQRDDQKEDEDPDSLQ